MEFHFPKPHHRLLPKGHFPRSGWCFHHENTLYSFPLIWLTEPPMLRDQIELIHLVNWIFKWLITMNMVARPAGGTEGEKPGLFHACLR